MKPIPEYDSAYRFPINPNGPNDSMSDMASDIIPLVNCLDGIGIVYVWSDGRHDYTPAWHHYRDVPPSQALERIERLAQIIATHYPDTTS